MDNLYIFHNPSMLSCLKERFQLRTAISVTGSSDAETSIKAIDSGEYNKIIYEPDLAMSRPHDIQKSLEAAIERDSEVLAYSIMTRADMARHGFMPGKHYTAYEFFFNQIDDMCKDLKLAYH